MLLNKRKLKKNKLLKTQRQKSRQVSLYIFLKIFYGLYNIELPKRQSSIETACS